jgi:CTP:molybdopterin cytidylyltransferase MocA
MIGVVLAAGRGERLGGPKALLAWPNDDSSELPLALAHVRARRECERVLVVTRADIAARLVSFGVTCEIVVSQAPDELGPAGSLAAAAPHLGFDEELVLVIPVDTPPAAADTVNALLAAMTPGVLAARPRHAGRRGHPVLLRARALLRYRAPDPPPLRDHLRDLDGVIDVDVDDRAVLADFDTSDDVEPRFL